MLYFHDDSIFYPTKVIDIVSSDKIRIKIALKLINLI